MQYIHVSKARCIYTRCIYLLCKLTTSQFYTVLTGNLLTDKTITILADTATANNLQARQVHDYCSFKTAVGIHVTPVRTRVNTKLRNRYPY